MKKFIIVISLIGLIAYSVFSSCAQYSYSGYEQENEAISCEDTVKIVTCGVVTIITIDSQTIFVTVDSVKIAADSKEITLSDTTVMFPQNIKLEKAIVTRPKLLNKKLKKAEKNYVVYANDYEVILWYGNIIIPIKFTKEIVAAITSGQEQTPDYSSRFNITNTEYLGTEPLITNEESYSRSYYHLTVEVYDGEYKIGTLTTKVSFYTANTPISFSADVSNWQNDTIRTDI